MKTLFIQNITIFTLVHGKKKDLKYFYSKVLKADNTLISMRYLGLHVSFY